MKRIVLFITALLLCVSGLFAQHNNQTRTKPDSSSTVYLKFESVPSKENVTSQNLLQNLVNSSTQATEGLATNISVLTQTLKSSIEETKITKADRVAQQLGITRDQINKAYSRNNKFLLWCVIPLSILVFWVITKWAAEKGLDVPKLITGSSMLVIYAFLGGGLAYLLLTLIFNSQYFTIKHLMSAFL